MDNRHWLLNFFRWDVRAILAGALGLLVIIGFAWAAIGDTLVIQFDFGGASLTDRAVGMTAVKGGVSVYPQTAGNLQFGWTTTGITEFSDKTVSDLMKRDYNSSSGSANFRISGLEQGTYRLEATAGAPSGRLSTRMSVGGLTTTITAEANVWQTGSLTVPVDSGTLDIAFNTADGLSPWGVCGLAVYRTVGTTSQASFAVSVVPSRQTVTAGSPVRFDVGVTGLNNYGSSVTAKVAGLVNGMTAEFMPAELAVLPGTMELTVYTANSVPATNYALLITVVGQDTALTQKTATITLTVQSSNDSSTVILPDNQPATNVTNSTSVVAPNLPLRSPQETRQDFVSIDQFAEAQRQKALNQNNFSEMKGISDTLAPLPVFEGLPKPKSTTELVLQKLVEGGIISSTTDSAPVVQQPEKKAGFWKNLVQIIFKPTS